MSDIIQLVPEHAQPGRGSKLPDPQGWVLQERVHDSGVLHGWRCEQGLVWVLSDLSQRAAMVARNAALARLRHPHVQELAGIGLLGKWPYRADVDPEGVPLDLLYQESGPWPVDKALDVALELAELLVELHGRGIVHGHIHPGALRQRGETLLLGDFPPLLGLDLPHNAPEVQLGAVADPRSDLFGLGYLTLCLLRGSRPDGTGREDTWRSGKAGPVAPLVRGAELSDTVSSLLRSLLDRDPVRRPGSALEVAQILARARAGDARKPPSLKIVGIAVAALLGLAGLSLAFDSTQPEPAAQQPGVEPASLATPTLPSAVPQGDPSPAPDQAPAPKDTLPSAGALSQEAAPTASSTPPAGRASPQERETWSATEEPAAVDTPAPELEAAVQADPVLTEAEPALAEVEPAAPEIGPTPADWSGTWTGTANGRPVRLELRVDADGDARGVVQQSLGAQQVRIPVRGTFALDGRFTLVETEGGRPTTWSGQVDGGSISGSMSSKGRDRGTFSVSR